MRILPNMTLARASWLQRLRDDGPARRGQRSRTGYDCMTLGWTEWNYCRNGEPISSEEASKALENGIIDYTWENERITPLGIEALKEAGYDRKDV